MADERVLEPRRRWRPTGRTLIVIGFGGLFVTTAWLALLVAIEALAPGAEVMVIVYLLAMVVSPLAFLVWAGVMVVLACLWFVARSDGGEPPVSRQVELPASLGASGGYDPELAGEIGRWRQRQRGPTKSTPKH
jgi:hypothetical protein